MPNNCMKAKSPHLLCDKCGRPATHMPMRLRGWWCSACCPACNAPGAPGGVEKASALESEDGNGPRGLARVPPSMEAASLTKSVLVLLALGAGVLSGVWGSFTAMLVAVLLLQDALEREGGRP